MSTSRRSPTPRPRTSSSPQLPDGYDAVVGERGIRLSGGQRQRIAIARALLVDPRILILDDSTSSVDFATESEIRERLTELRRNRLAFVIAQRISSVREADLIIVLDQGRIVAVGTHTSLQDESPPVRRDLRLATRGRSGGSGEPMIIGGGFTGGSGSMHIGAELQKAGDRRGTLRRFNHFLSGYRVPITGIALMIVVEVVLTSYAPRMLQVAVDDIAAYLDGGRSLPEARRTVELAMVVALGLFAAGWGANAVARWRMVGVGQGILANIRRDVFAKVHALSLGYFDSVQAGDLLSRMANDTSVIDRVLRMGAVRMLQSFLQVIGILVAMLALSWRMALVSFTVLPVMMLFTWYFSRKARVAFRRTRQTMGVVSSHLERNIVGVREIQAFGRERDNAGAFRRANAANRDANVNAEDDHRGIRADPGRAGGDRHRRGAALGRLPGRTRSGHDRRAGGVRAVRAPASSCRCAPSRSSGPTFSRGSPAWSASSSCLTTTASPPSRRRPRHCRPARGRWSCAACRSRTCPARRCSAAST